MAKVLVHKKNNPFNINFSCKHIYSPNTYPTVELYISKEVLSLRDCSSNEMKIVNILHYVFVNGNEEELKRRKEKNISQLLEYHAYRLATTRNVRGCAILQLPTIYALYQVF